MKKILVCMMLVLSAVAYAQFFDNGFGPGGTVVETVIVNPKYSVAEAIELCVNDMNERGERVNENNLRKALNRMTAAEVHLPPQKDLNQLIRNAVQKYHARAQKKIMQDNPPPTVADYSSEKEFVAAYVDYKVDHILPYEREQWSRKLGGMNGFRREKKNEAIKIWRRKARK